MDDHRENGRHKPEMYKAPQSQWLMQQPQSMKHIMSIMAERDAAIQERNMAISEKNKALEERDLAIMQRDTAIQERNEAIMERDSALAALQFRQNSMNGGTIACPPGCQISRGVKHAHHPQQHHVQHASHVGEPSYDGREVQLPDAPPMPSPPDTTKTRKVKRTKEPNAVSPNKKSKPGRKVKKEGEDLNTMMFSKSQEWKGMQDMDGNDDYKQMGGSKPDWKGPDLGLNQVAFDESSMPPPVCSCTGCIVSAINGAMEGGNRRAALQRCPCTHCLQFPTNGMLELVAER